LAAADRSIFPCESRFAEPVAVDVCEPLDVFTAGAECPPCDPLVDVVACGALVWVEWEELDPLCDEPDDEWLPVETCEPLLEWLAWEPVEALCDDEWLPDFPDE
jgi:hypothetical protein